MRWSAAYLRRAHTTHDRVPLNTPWEEPLQPMPSYLSPNVESRSTAERGLGLFARRDFARDELIVVTLCQVVHWTGQDEYNEQVHPFQIEIDVVAIPRSAEISGMFSVNHSCSPNAGLRGQLSLVALRPITAGEEICYDYVMTDSDYFGKSVFQMDCLCGSPDCRKRVSDTDWRRKDLQEKYRGYFSSYLAARIRSE